MRLLTHRHNPDSQSPRIPQFSRDFTSFPFTNPETSSSAQRISIKFKNVMRDYFKTLYLLFDSTWIQYELTHRQWIWRTHARGQYTSQPRPSRPLPPFIPISSVWSYTGHIGQNLASGCPAPTGHGILQIMSQCMHCGIILDFFFLFK